MFLGVDLGLGSLKAVLIDRRGTVLGEASRAVSTRSPADGRAEQDPDEWGTAMQGALADLGAQRPLAQVDAISFTAGTHTAVLLDKQGAVVRPPILWADQRAGVEAIELNERLGDRLLAVAHNVAAATWSIAPLYWLQRHEPLVTARVARVQFVKDWLRSQLTGDRLTDHIDAQGSLLLDVERGQWSPELCDAIGWPIGTLPEVRRPTDLAGTVTAQAAIRLGLRAGTPVFIGTCDTAAEVWAAGATQPGDTVVKLASAGVVNIVSTAPTKRRDAPSKAFVIPGRFYALGAINSCATGHKWLSDLLLGEEADEAAFSGLDRMAQDVAPGADGLLFHPYLRGERAPYWDPKLRASFVGLNMRHGRGHLVRAFYEGIAYALRDAARPLADAGLSPGPISLIGGGARSDLWAQVIADVFDRPVRRPLHGDASYGAALLAAVGAGAFASPADAVQSCVRHTEPLLPQPGPVARYDLLFERYRRVKDLLTALNHEISGA
jgi:xylulokinase